MPEFGPLISASELQRRLGSVGWRIVDCRFDLMDPTSGRAAWRSAHIPGAVYADLNKDLAGPITATSGRHPLPDVAGAASMAAALGIGDETRVVVYDDAGGGIAARAWWMLRWLGHRHVALLDGGFANWLGEQRPVEQGELTVARAGFMVSVRPDWVMTTEGLEAVLRDTDDYCLVDARDPARFAGETEPIDPVAGHIPGALNLPFGLNLRANGRWKAPGELRRLWADAVGDRAGGDWSVMCGSGVTACHLAVSAKLAGLAAPRIYIGSWSEWIRDPARPRATGP